MDIDLSELDIFTKPYPTGISARHRNVLHIDKSTFLNTITECRAEVESLLNKCDMFYHSDNHGRAFENKIRSTTYSIHTGKGDASITDVQKYNIRDAVQWLTMWIGKYENPLWNCIAKNVAFTTSLDDICVPYVDIEDGTYEFAGESLSVLLKRLETLGGDRDRRWLVDCLKDTLFAVRLQFYEKWAVCQDKNARCPNDINFINLYTKEPDILRASIIRNFDGMTNAVLCLISYYYNFKYDDCDWALFNAACIGDTLGMDIGKEAAGIGKKCPTNFIDRSERYDSVCDLYIALNRLFRDTNCLQAIVYGRFSRVALSFSSMHDRYIERQSMTRLPIVGLLHELVECVAQTVPSVEVSNGTQTSLVR